MKKCVLILLLSFTGCAETNLYEEKQKVLNSWIGKKDDQLVEALGIPDREKEVGSFHYEQYDHRCLYFLPSTGEYVGSALASLGNAIGTAAGRQASPPIGQPEIHSLCERWLFKFKETVIVKAFAGWQFSESPTQAAPKPVSTPAAPSGDYEKDLMKM